MESGTTSARLTSARLRLLLTLAALASATVAAAPPAPAAAQMLVETESEGAVRMGNLPFYYDLYTFRGDGGRTLVVGSFAVPAGGLEAGRALAGAGLRYRFDVSLVLADTAAGTIYRTDDSVFVAASRPLSGEHLLFTYVDVVAPPSGTIVHRALMNDATTPGVGQLYRGPFRIPDYSGSDLMISDVALGQPEALTGWRRGDAVLALLPTSRFPASSFDVYYEIYNLPDGHPYTTEVWVEPVEEGAEPAAEAPPHDDAVALRFSDDARPRPDGAVAELRLVDAALGTGRYRLTIVVTDDLTGATARRTRLFHVRGRDPGATLITALPRSGPIR